jgi:hypothetical protein
MTSKLLNTEHEWYPSGYPGPNEAHKRTYTQVNRETVLKNTSYSEGGPGDV